MIKHIYLDMGKKISPNLALILCLISFALIKIATTAAIIDFNIYQCQQADLLKRIDQMHTYVDYFLVFEAEQQEDAGFCFNRLNFVQYNRQVIYLPVRNIPGKFQSFNKQESLLFVDSTIKNILNLLALDDDIVVFGNIKNIISKDVLELQISQKLQINCFQSHSSDNRTLIVTRKAIWQEYEQNPRAIIARRYCPKFDINPVSDQNLVKPVPIPKRLYEATTNFSRRVVFDCLPYNGENHILDLKMRIGDPFVDFYIITQGAWTHTGLAKALRFNFTAFEYYQEHVNKIIYLPLRNVPNMVQDQTAGMKWANQRLMREAAVFFLKPLGKPNDIIIVGDLDQILSAEGFFQFDAGRYEWMGTYQRLGFWYFNRFSFFDTPERKQMPNYLIRGTKITYISAFERLFFFNITNLRSSNACHEPGFTVDYASTQRSYKVKCEVNYIHHAGWHFTSVLKNEELIKKFYSAADFDKDNKIVDFESLKRGSAFFSYNIDVDLFDQNLPKQLVYDIVMKGKKSRFAEYFIRLDPNVYKLSHRSKIYINQYLDYQPDSQIPPRQPQDMDIQIEDQNEQKKQQNNQIYIINNPSPPEENKP